MPWWEIGKSVLIESVAGKEIEQAKQTLSVQFASLLHGWDIQADLDTDIGLNGPYWERSIEASRFGLDIFIGAAGILAGSSGKGEAGKVASTILPKSIIDLSEANITKNGKTVIGHFKIDEGMGGVNYIDKAKQLKASYFSLGEAWGILEPAERLAANAHFLDVIAAKGDVVILSVPKTNIKPNTSLAWEIEYLINTHGYEWVGEILKKSK